MRTFVLALALAVAGCSAADYAIMAKSAHEKRSYDEMLGYAKQATEMSPEYPAGWYWLGIAHIEKRQWAEAIPAFEKALTLKPSAAQLQSSHAQLGRAYFERNQMDLAAPHLQRAIALKSDDASAHNVLGLVYSRRAQRALAVMSFRGAVEIKSADPTFVGNLGAEYYRNGNYAEAVETFERAIALGNTDRAGLEPLRRALAERGPGPRFDPQSASAPPPTHGSLGVTLQPLTPELVQSLGVPDDKGALVNNTVSGGPAARGGLRQGDVIRELNGVAIDDAAALVRAVTQTKPGQTGRFVIWRDRAQHTITMRFGEFPAGTGIAATAPAAPTPAPVSPPPAQAPVPAATSAGSGFVLRNTNLVLTNHHVIADRSRVTVSFPNGESYPGRVVARDPGNDLALIELQGRPAGAGLALAATTGIRAGETVHAIGYPLGGGLSRQPSIVSGQVSSAVGMGDDIARFRTTAPINPGNSGGPMVNAQGQVIGIAAAGLVRQGVEAIRFGIKASTATVILQQSRAAQTAFDIVVSAAPPPAMSPADVFAKVSPYVVLIEAQ
jgi:S1-C subfamily serine protease/Flp pilus assembly protein TadD